MKLTMVGTGYVGLVTGACLANTGNDVICLDIDRPKIDRLNRGEVPIYEPSLRDLIVRNTSAGRLTFSTDKNQAYRDPQVIFICVGTPPNEDGSADVTHVLAAAEDIARAIDQLGPSAAPKLVVVKSTVPVGTSHRVRDLIRSATKNKFYIANNPEFLKEGSAVSDFLKPDRVIVGVEDEAAGEIIRDLYEPFVRQGNPIYIMDVRSSEMVKYASNAMLATKISFINEMANLCEHYGADIRSVREGMCADHRIGKSFLYPGLGYGGSCFPKDTLAVVRMGRDAGFNCKLNAAVHEVNQDQRLRFWKKIEDHFGGRVSGKSLAFWGIAFKPETDDIREAPSLTLMRCALEAGVNVKAYDPVAAANLNGQLPKVRTVERMYDALDGADGLVVCTEWSEFRNPDFDQIAKRLRSKTIFDGRNIYRREQMQRLGFSYYCIGRPDVKGK
ncbi:MAG: UDP-glucose/GDP-mannose dehydrogenase family protein [Phycisphaerales bacterium]|nr:UDP-glucose/GDP-mannose dehydrogenase family protein [Phycisphaerales bacterium]MCI0630314.1 UDP-glucose/GDP-mannose dehydrogenase family protein [Phycisphaerales bacterium]MCI0674707.1 UDP-glucose/GDP-mannose dehydrogenase family protein [Phycisphaerales bacterium]